MRSGHGVDQPAQLANTLALISIAENLDALVEIGIDAIGGLKQIVRVLEAGPITPARWPRSSGVAWNASNWA